MEWRGNAQPNREVVCGVKCTQRRVLTASTEYIRRFLGGFMAKYCEFLDGDIFSGSEVQEQGGIARRVVYDT